MSDATDTYLGEEPLEDTVVDNFLDLNMEESINGVTKKSHRCHLIRLMTRTVN